MTVTLESQPTEVEVVQALAAHHPIPVPADLTPAEAAVLAGALLTTLGHREVAVADGIDPAWLARTGLLFALAHRPGPLRASDALTAALARQLPSWRDPWTRPSEPSVAGPDHVAFTHPHRARPHSADDVVRPWLAHLLPPLARLRPTGAHELAFPDALARVIDALVDDVAGPPDDVASCVLAARSRGVADPRFRLHVVVAHTGAWRGDRDALLRFVRAWDDVRLLALGDGHALHAVGEDVRVEPVEPVVGGGVVVLSAPLPPRPGR